MSNGLSPSQRQATLRKRLEDQLKRIREDCNYSGKGQFEAGRRWGLVHLWIGLPTSIVAGLAGVSAISAFDNHEIWAAILAFSAAAATATSTFLNAEKRSTTHHNAGAKYFDLRDKATQFQEVDLLREIDDEELVERVAGFSDARSALRSSSPPIPGWAFERARAGIEAGETTYKVDKAQAQSRE